MRILYIDCSLNPHSVHNPLELLAHTNPARLPKKARDRPQHIHDPPPVDPHRIVRSETGANAAIGVRCGRRTRQPRNAEEFRGRAMKTRRDYDSTSASSWGGAGWSGRTASCGSWWRVGAGERSSCEREEEKGERTCGTRTAGAARESVGKLVACAREGGAKAVAALPTHNASAAVTRATSAQVARRCQS